MEGGWEVTTSKAIWSLYDVLRFYAEFFVEACFCLERLRTIIDRVEGWEIVGREFLLMFKQECERTGFTYLAEQTDRIIYEVKQDIPELSQRKKTTVRALIEELQKGLDYKLKSCTFLRLDTFRKTFYSEEDLPRFGKEIEKAFPKTTYHIAEACRCFALERWDACVHHLMLATEEVLRKWARNLGLKADRPLVLADWEKILQQARSLLTALKNKPKTHVSDRRIQRLAESLANFELIKEAWRNYSSHGREKYDERRARNIINHVELFMQSLVRKKSVSSRS
jgi:hypothetical protein